MADLLDGIFISEVLADNAGTSATDTDGNGTINKSDEFIELQNASGSTLSLDGFEVWSEKEGLLYSFDATDTIAPGETATIVGDYDGTPPPGYYDANKSEDGNFIPDGEGGNFDTIFLVNTNTGEYIVLSYGDPPLTPTLPTGFPGTTQVGSGESIISGAPNGTSFTRDINGNLVESTPTPGTPDIPCFLGGTWIDTPHGQVQVERLVPGQTVLTLDHGPQPLLAIGQYRVSLPEIKLNPTLRSITLPAGFGGATHPLQLSAAHRVVLSSAVAELMFEHTQVLVAAHRVAQAHGIGPDRPTRALRYFHLLLANHEIIRANGAWVESLFLGDVAARALHDPHNWVIDPTCDMTKIEHPETARPALKGHETDVLLASITPPTCTRTRKAA